MMSRAVSHSLDGTRMIFQWGLAVSLVLALSSFSLQFANPSEFKWEFASLCSICIVLEAAVIVWRGRLRPALDLLDWALLAFLGYAALSLMWSVDADSGKLALIKWLLLVIPFLYLKHLGTPWLKRLLLRAIATGSAIVMFFAISGYASWGGFGNENFLTEFQLISLPFLASLLRLETGVTAKALVLLVMGLEVVDLVVFNPSRIEWMVAAGLLFLLAERFLWRRLPVFQWSSLNLLGLAALGAMIFWLWQHTDWPEGFYRESIRPRFALMLNTLRLWLDAPFFGHGAGSFDAVYPLYKEWHLHYFEHADKLLSDKMVKAGAAHNEILQFLAEYGLVGIALLGGMAFRLIRCRLALPLHDPYAGAGSGALGVGFIIALIEFPLQNPATALLLSVGAGLLAAGSRRGEEMASPESEGVLRRLVPVFISSWVVLLALGDFRFDQSNRLFGRVGETIAVDPRQAFELNCEAYRLDPWDRRIRVQLYTTLTFWAENSEVPVSSHEENDRTYGLSTRGAENQPVLMLGRIQHLLNSGRYEDKREETEALLDKLKRYSSRMADVWILEAYYALLREDRSRAAAALDRAQSLDPTPEQRGNLLRLRQNL